MKNMTTIKNPKSGVVAKFEKVNPKATKTNAQAQIKRALDLMKSNIYIF
jgi:hypothetical protein